MTDVHIRLGGPLQVLHRRQQDLMDLLRDKEQTISTLKQENATLEAENRNARNSLMELQHKKDEANSYSSQLHQEIEQVAQKLSNYKQESQRYQEHAESLERENRSLQQVVDDNNAEVERLRQENGTLYERLESESTARQRTQKQLDALSSRFEHYKKSMTDRINDLNSTITNLQSKLENSEKHVALLQKEKNRLQDEVKNASSQAQANATSVDRSSGVAEERNLRTARDCSQSGRLEAPRTRQQRNTQSPAIGSLDADENQQEGESQRMQAHHASASGNGRQGPVSNDSIVVEQRERANPYAASESHVEHKRFVDSFFYESAAETVTILRQKLRNLRAEYEKLQSEYKRLQQKMTNRKIQNDGIKNLKRKVTKSVGTDQ
eukprot:gb/GECG01005050.1/.p1 GENE.gb/GECG01005050.1/~~gb/GECG01005050.1/.p1  ORF type:complete len:380 (+),score=71.17 gb/GECG01005050.1/:1-1140(+)